MKRQKLIPDGSIANTVTNRLVPCWLLETFAKRPPFVQLALKVSADASLRVTKVPASGYVS